MWSEVRIGWIITSCWLLYEQVNDARHQTYMCFAIQVSGIILRPFYGRVRSPYIAVSIFLELPSSVYDLRATKSNRPANLPGQSVSFRQLPSPRPFKRSNSFLPSFNASRLRLFNRETLRFLSLLPFCPVTSYHNGTIAHPWNIYIYTERIYTRVNPRSHVCIESRKGLTRMEDFSMGSVIDMFVDTWTLGKVCDRRIVWVTGIRLTVGWKVCEHPHAPQVFRPWVYEVTSMHKHAVTKHDKWLAYIGHELLSAPLLHRNAPCSLFSLLVIR